MKKAIFKRVSALVLSVALGACTLFVPGIANAETNVTVSTSSFVKSTDQNPDVVTEDNLILRKKPLEKAIFKNGTRTVDTVVWNNLDANMTDGITAGDVYYNTIQPYELGTDGKADLTKPLNSAPYNDSDLVYYADIAYDFSDVCEVNRIAAYGHMTYPTAVYKIYLSEEKDKLFNEESLVYTYVNDDFSAKQEFTFANAVNARYFGFRVVETHTSKNTANPGFRFSELAVYGVSPNVNVVTSNYSLSASENADVCTDNNLLYGKVPVERAIYDNGTRTVAADNNTWNGTKTALTNGITNQEGFYSEITPYEKNADNTVDLTKPLNAAPYNDSELKYYADFTYDLSAVSNIEKIAAYGHTTYPTAVYKLYLSENKDTLYNEESLIYTYVNDDFSSKQEFTLKNAVTARYFGFRVVQTHTSKNTANRGFRFSELAVYGTPAQTECTVKFNDLKGNVIYSTTVLEGETVSTDDMAAAKEKAPYIFGYDFKGFDKADDYVITGDTTFTTVYEQQSNLYTVTVTDKDGTATNNYKFDERVRISTSTADFALWKTGEQVVSKEQSFEIYVPGNVEFTAVYTGEEGADAEVDAARIPVAPQVSAEYTVGSNTYFNATVMANVTLPENATFVKAGVLFANTAAAGYNETDFAVGTTAFKTKDINFSNNVSDFMVTLSKIRVDQTRAARAYICYNDGTGEKYAYSKIYTFDASGVK